MKTEGTQFCFLFHAAKRRGVVARFEGGRISSDAGGLLLREVEKRTEIVKRLAGCFRDHREAGRTEHRVEELVGQRVYALALGYEDLNDHEELRRDPLLALLAGKEDLTGEERVRARDTGNPLAGKSTLNRLELTRATVAREERYKKIALDTEAVDRALVEVFLEAHREAPPEIVLDLDATDDPVHGQQEGRFFHGYYREYCSLPLYIFCGEHLLCARRDGEPHQGAATGPSHLDGDVAGQSDPPLFFFLRLSADGSATPVGIEGHGTGAGAGPDDSPEAAEDRGTAAGDSAEGLGVDSRELSLRRCLWTSLQESQGRASAVLSQCLKHSRRTGCRDALRAGLRPRQGKACFRMRRSGRSRSHPRMRS